MSTRIDIAQMNICGSPELYGSMTVQGQEEMQQRAVGAWRKISETGTPGRLLNETVRAVVHRVHICLNCNSHFFHPDCEQWWFVPEKQKLLNPSRGQKEPKIHFTLLYVNTACLITLTLCGYHCFLFHCYFAQLKTLFGCQLMRFSLHDSMIHCSAP